MLLELVLTGLILHETQTTKLEEVDVRGIEQYVVYDRSNNTRNFTLGDSRFQSEMREQERMERDRRKRSYSINAGGQSYTGQGEAEIIGESWEQCVIYAKRRSGITRTIGYAGNAQTQGNTPQVGSIGIEKSKVGHAVFIEAIDGERITITEANYKKGKITKRVLLASQIRGYIYN